MTNATKVALLLMTDPMIREGLKLLLTDMHFNVISTNSVTDLEKQLTTTNSTPDLILFPLLLDDKLTDTEEPAIYFVRRLRKRFGVSIPAILLDNELHLQNMIFSDNNLVVLPENIQPSKLRQTITQHIHAQ